MSASLRLPAPVLSCQASSVRPRHPACRIAGVKRASHCRVVRECRAQGLPRTLQVRCRAATDSSGGEGGGSGAKKDTGGNGEGAKGQPMQLWTYIYAVFLAAGGAMGYLKAKSSKSLGAGMSAAVIMAVCAYQLGGPAALSAATVACVISAALTGVMGMRFYNTKKVMPAGVTALMSAGMTIGFLLTSF